MSGRDYRAVLLLVVGLSGCGHGAQPSTLRLHEDSSVAPFAVVRAIAAAENQSALAEVSGVPFRAAVRCVKKDFKLPECRSMRAAARDAALRRRIFVASLQPSSASRVRLIATAPLVTDHTRTRILIAGWQTVRGARCLAVVAAANAALYGTCIDGCHAACFAALPDPTGPRWIVAGGASLPPRDITITDNNHSLHLAVAEFGSRFGLTPIAAVWPHRARPIAVAFNGDDRTIVVTIG